MFVALTKRLAQKGMYPPGYVTLVTPPQKTLMSVIMIVRMFHSNKSNEKMRLPEYFKTVQSIPPALAQSIQLKEILTHPYIIF